MDSTKRDLIENVLILANTEQTVALIVEEYANKYKKSHRDVIQSCINDIVIDVIYKQARVTKDYENIMAGILGKDKNVILNIF